MSDSKNFIEEAEKFKLCIPEKIEKQNSLFENTFDLVLMVSSLFSLTFTKLPAMDRSDY